MERYLSSGSGDEEESESSLFNVAIATIFAREFLEGAIIILNYRTVIKKSPDWDDDRKKQALRTVTISALFATLIAVLVVVAVAVPLGMLSKDLDERVVEIIEGVSKVVASICILQLSLKIPVWLGLYQKAPLFYWCNGSLKKKNAKELENLTLREIRFNVAWNIWREVAECGVFLIPFFLGTGAKAVPLSALVGIGISAVLGLGIYIANQRIRSKIYLSTFMSGLTLFLSVGLMVGGLHEFEEVWGMTKNVYKIQDDFWSSKQLPMVLLKPFGYSSSRSVLQITTFWVMLAFGCTLHCVKYKSAKRAAWDKAANEEDDDVDEQLEKKDLEAPDESSEVEETAHVEDTAHIEDTSSSNDEDSSPPSPSNEDDLEAPPAVGGSSKVIYSGTY